MTCLTDISDVILLDLVRSAVATVFEVPVETLDSGTRLVDGVDGVDADSLAMIEIVEIVEEELRAKGSAVRVDDHSLARMQTVGDVVTALLAAGRTGVTH